MSQEKNGRKSFCPKEHLKAFEQLLDEYLDAVKFKVFQDENIDEIISMNENQFRFLDNKQIKYYTFVLTRYSIFLQQEQNRHKNRSQWAKNNLNRIVAHSISNYGSKFMPYEYRKQLVIDDNKTAKMLDNIILHANSRVQELEFQSSKVKSLGSILLTLAEENK